MLGTFPPKPERWSMDFYYPNKINDMWRIMGLIAYRDRNHFWDDEAKRFKLADIKAFLAERRIALWDTAMAVRRLRDNASDQFLEIVEPIDLPALLALHPTINAVATAGQKATDVVARMACVSIPPVGQAVRCRVGEHELELWRMPSSSRAYPLSLDNKAAAYERMMRHLGLL